MRGRGLGGRPACRRTNYGPAGGDYASHRSGAADSSFDIASSDEHRTNNSPDYGASSSTVNADHVHRSRVLGAGGGLPDQGGSDQFHGDVEGKGI